MLINENPINGQNGTASAQLSPAGRVGPEAIAFKASRNALGISQAILARALGLSLRQIIRYETGDSLPPAPVVAIMTGWTTGRWPQSPKPKTKTQTQNTNPKHKSETQTQTPETDAGQFTAPQK
jgi:transcriptional regulator with XRE-family HTH domain